MSALLSEEDNVKKRISGLKEELREAEMKVAIGDTSNVMHTMSSGSSGGVRRLGPSVFAEIRVNGTPTKALIDTGSPATIASLDCILRILASQRESRQSPEQ